MGDWWVVERHGVALGAWLAGDPALGQAASRLGATATRVIAAYVESGTLHDLRTGAELRPATATELAVDGDPDTGAFAMGGAL